MEMSHLIMEAQLNAEEEIDIKSGKGQVIKSTDDDEKELEIKEQHSAPLKDSSEAVKKWRRDKETKRRMKLKIEEKLIGDQDGESGEDNDSCEEWERHEAIYHDVSNQERNTERLFEEEIEVGEGGSGLVLYTDAQYLKQLEGGLY